MRMTNARQKPNGGRRRSATLVRPISDDELEAEKLLLDSTTLVPEDPNAWNGLFTFYVRTNKLDQARHVLEQMAAKAKFGGELVCYGRHIYVHMPFFLKLGQLGYAMYRKFL